MMYQVLIRLLFGLTGVRGETLIRSHGHEASKHFTANGRIADSSIFLPDADTQSNIKIPEHAVDLINTRSTGIVRKTQQHMPAQVDADGNVRIFDDTSGNNLISADNVNDGKAPVADESLEEKKHDVQVQPVFTATSVIRTSKDVTVLLAAKEKAFVEDLIREDAANRVRDGRSKMEYWEAQLLYKIALYVSGPLDLTQEVRVYPSISRAFHQAAGIYRQASRATPSLANHILISTFVHSVEFPELGDGGSVSTQLLLGNAICSWKRLGWKVLVPVWDLHASTGDDAHRVISRFDANENVITLSGRELLGLLWQDVPQVFKKEDYEDDPTYLYKVGVHLRFVAVQIALSLGFTATMMDLDVVCYADPMQGVLPMMPREVDLACVANGPSKLDQFNAGLCMFQPSNAVKGALNHWRIAVGHGLSAAYSQLWFNYLIARSPAGYINAVSWPFCLMRDEADRMVLGESFCHHFIGKDKATMPQTPYWVLALSPKVSTCNSSHMGSDAISKVRERCGAEPTASNTAPDMKHAMVASFG